jgi:phosphatidylglycerophosphatase A
MPLCPFQLHGVEGLATLFESNVCSSSTEGAFSCYMLMPSALQFLLNYLGIQAQLCTEAYFDFVTGLMLLPAMASEFPS